MAPRCALVIEIFKMGSEINAVLKPWEIDSVMFGITFADINSLKQVIFGLQLIIRHQNLLQSTKPDSCITETERKKNHWDPLVSIFSWDRISNIYHSSYTETSINIEI